MESSAEQEISGITLDPTVPLSKQMRRATRDIHSISDTLVNAKLGFALSDEHVWAEGLMVFYEIFRYLEDAVDRRPHPCLCQIDLQGMRRTTAFESDLAHYLGEGWRRGYQVRDSVARYLHHLHQVESQSPHVLTAYVYHLYMGLMSGGQLLRQKMNLKRRLRLSIPTSPPQPNDQSNSPVQGSQPAGQCPQPGMAVTDFSPLSISSLKRRLREAVDGLVGVLSEQECQQVLAEGRTVFALNNELVRSVRGANQAVARKVLTLIGFLLMVVAMVKIYAWF